VSRRLADVRTWSDGGRLRPGGSLTSVAVETPLTSSASSAATTAGGGGGSDVSGCVAYSLDDDEAARSTSPPLTIATLPASRPHNEHRVGDFPTAADNWNQSALRRMVSGVDNDCRRSSSLSVCYDEDANTEQHLQRLRKQRQRRQFRRRQQRAATGQPSSTSLDELPQRTPPKLVQSSASLSSAPVSDVAAQSCCFKDAWKSTTSDSSCRSTPTNSVLVDLLPLQNGNLCQPNSSAIAATTRTARSAAPPLTDGGLCRPDRWSQDSTLHAAKPMTTTWVANKAQTTVGGPPQRARNAWSKSQEIHPKTGGGVSSLRGSASATLIPIRRRSSLHAVFVDDSRTAVLKDVVNHTVIAGIALIQFSLTPYLLLQPKSSERTRQTFLAL